MQQSAIATWNGSLQSGTLTSGTGSFTDLSFGAEFEPNDHPCAHPMELFAAAQATCISITLAQLLSTLNSPPDFIEVSAIVTLGGDDDDSFRITSSYLDIRVVVTHVGLQQLHQLAQQTINACPICKLLKGVAELSFRVELASEGSQAAAV